MGRLIRKIGRHPVSRMSADTSTPPSAWPITELTPSTAV